MCSLNVWPTRFFLDGISLAFVLPNGCSNPIVFPTLEYYKPYYSLNNVPNWCWFLPRNQHNNQRWEQLIISCTHKVFNSTTLLHYEQFIQFFSSILPDVVEGYFFISNNCSYFNMLGLILTTTPGWQALAYNTFCLILKWLFSKCTIHFLCF